jgi:hypothetical protein
LPVDAVLRLSLWASIEAYLVKQRRYQDAAIEPDGLAVVRYYVTLLSTPGEGREHPTVRQAIQFTVEYEGGNHFEALAGTGETAAAEALADELIQCAPTGHTLAILIQRARRAGATELASHLRAKANEVVPVTERNIVDEAMK